MASSNNSSENKYLEHLNFRIRQGRIGSSWRHIKQTNNYSGNNLLFIDGKLKNFDKKLTNIIYYKKIIIIKKKARYVSTIV